MYNRVPIPNRASLTDNKVSAIHNKCFMEILPHIEPVSSTNEVKSMHDQCMTELQSQTKHVLTDNEISAMHNKCFIEIL